MLERVWRKGNPPTLLLEMWIGTATLENSVEGPLKTENRATIWPCSPTSGHILGKGENSNLKRYTCPNVHTNTIHNSQDMEAI